MKKLIFFSNREKYFKVEGSSLAAYFAAFLLKKRNLKYQFERKEVNKLNFIENFYLPQRLASYFNLKNSEIIKYYLITDKFIIPISGNPKVIKKYISKKDFIKLKELLYETKKIKSKFSLFLRENFSENFNLIIKSIFGIYRIYNFDELDYHEGIIVIRDFFSRNYLVNTNFLSSFFENVKFFNRDLINKPIIFSEHFDASIKSFSLTEVLINCNNNLFNNFWPEKVYFINEELNCFMEKLSKNYRIIFIKGDENNLIKILKEFYSHNQFFIEKKLLKDYRAVVSKHKRFLGKFAFFPFNLYTLFHSIEKLINMEA